MYRWQTEIAKQAKQLTVFQRRPNWAAPLHNSKISKQEMEEIKSRYDEIYARCAKTPSWFIHTADPRKTLDVPPEEREVFWEKLYGEPGFGIWMANFRDVPGLHRFDRNRQKSPPAESQLPLAADVVRHRFHTCHQSVRIEGDIFVFHGRNCCLITATAVFRDFS